SRRRPTATTATTRPSNGAPAVPSTRPPTAASTSASWPGACPPCPSAASASTTPARTPTSSSPSSTPRRSAWAPRPTSSSWAARAGLKPGDVIEGLDRQKVTGFRQLLQQLTFHNPGDKVTLKVLRGKDHKEVVLTVGPGMARPGPARPTRPNGFWYGGQRENV